MEKSDVSISNSLDYLSQDTETPTIKLNLVGRSVISRYIQDFENKYGELYWLGDYLQSIISYTNLNTRKLSLELNFSSQEVLIFQNEILKIIYCLQKQPLTSEELTFKTESYKLQGVNCRWFFSSEAKNVTSYSWACKQFGYYCFLERQENSTIINAYQWNLNDSVAFPIDYQSDLVIIRNALDNH